jgi:hypothetical protein
MGADGWLRIIKTEDFTAAFPDVGPQEIGLRAESIVGVDCLIAYNDTSDRNDMDDTWSPLGFTKARVLSLHRNRLNLAREAGGHYQSEYMKKNRMAGYHEAECAEQVAALESDPDLPHSERCNEAAYWFDAHAQQIMCWT